MKIVKGLLAAVMVYIALPVFAENEVMDSTITHLGKSSAYVSDDLFIFTHAGAGKNYRILGRLLAGTAIKLTGEHNNDFSEIIDDKERTVWVESQYLSATPGLRFVIAELNSQQARLTEKNTQLNAELIAAQNEISNLEQQQKELTNEISAVKKELTATQAQLKDQDMNIMKQWFYNGASVLAIGILLGLVLPRIAGRKRKNADSWQ